jgi:hypothetical protein
MGLGLVREGKDFFGKAQKIGMGGGAFTDPPGAQGKDGQYQLQKQITIVYAGYLHSASGVRDNNLPFDAYWRLAVNASQPMALCSNSFSESGAHDAKFFPASRNPCFTIADSLTLFLIFQPQSLKLWQKRN